MTELQTLREAQAREDAIIESWRKVADEWMVRASKAEHEASKDHRRFIDSQAELRNARADLSVNAKLLSHQMDLARQAEIDRDDARAESAHYQELWKCRDDECRDLKSELGLADPRQGTGTMRRTCDGCRYQSKGDGLKVCWHSPIKCTVMFGNIGLTHYPKCEDFGNACGAWVAKEQL